MDDQFSYLDYIIISLVIKLHIKDMYLIQQSFAKNFLKRK